mmetsp:Transcript_36336/g.100124  ORF Transcript_36336/g.100124 Transcript_36336/m.100124 type:complete len:193 (-) Transcript_36336:222-800(-)
MDSYSARANSIFCTFVTVLGVTAVLNHVSVIMLPQFKATPSARVEMVRMHDLTVNTYYNIDQSTLSFAVSHDFTSEFHWNMNQLFVYLVASYNDTTNKRNEITLWDSVVTGVQDANFTSRQLMVEYPLRDEFKELRGRDVTLTLKYRTMPITGVMHMKEAAQCEFKTPEEYFRDETRVDKDIMKKGSRANRR